MGAGQSFLVACGSVQPRGRLVVSDCWRLVGSGALSPCWRFRARWWEVASTSSPGTAAAAPVAMAWPAAPPFPRSLAPGSTPAPARGTKFLVPDVIFGVGVLSQVGEAVKGQGGVRVF